MRNIKIAVDGPAGAGKSSIAKLIASSLGVEYIDTGSMYRALTLKLLKNNCNINNQKDVEEILNQTEIDFYNNSIFLDGKNVDTDIRTPEVNEKVSTVSSIKIVRDKLVSIQKKLAEKKSVIMDGRDIGTIVLPNAEYKFYLTASVEERAKRRWKEMKEKDFNVSLEEIKRDILNRDQQDMNRLINPLKRADGAIEINSTGKTMEEVVEEILSYII